MYLLDKRCGFRYAQVQLVLLRITEPKLATSSLTLRNQLFERLSPSN